MKRGCLGCWAEILRVGRVTLRDRGRATPPENQPFLPILGVLGFGALLKASTLTGVFGNAENTEKCCCHVASISEANLTFILGR